MIVPRSHVKAALGKSPLATALLSAELYPNDNAGNFFLLVSSAVTAASRQV